MSGTYVGVKFSESSANRLTEWLSTQELPNKVDPKTFHLTVVYSRKELELPIFNRQVNWLCWASGFKIFDDSKCALVLTLISPEVVDSHYRYRLNNGATHDYPDFTPHLTLSYDVPADFDVSRLTLPEGNFELVEEYSAKLDLTWTGQDRREQER